MNVYEIIEALKQQKKKFNKYAEEIQKAIEILEENMERTSTYVNGEPGVHLGICEVIKKMFDEDPQKDWTPPALRDELQKMRTKGLLKSKAKKLLSSVHLPLQRLVRNEYVKKIGSGLNAKYRKSIH